MYNTDRREKGMSLLHTKNWPPTLGMGDFKISIYLVLEDRRRRPLEFGMLKKEAIVFFEKK
jgi:hypothetical protein